MRDDESSPQKPHIASVRLTIDSKTANVVPLASRQPPRKPLKWKIVEDYDGDTYRAVYTAAFAEVVYVLDVFMKRSKSGIKTPQADKNRVLQRFKAAKQHHDDNYGTRGGK